MGGYEKYPPFLFCVVWCKQIMLFPLILGDITKTHYHIIN